MLTVEWLEAEWQGAWLWSPGPSSGLLSPGHSRKQRWAQRQKALVSVPGLPLASCVPPGQAGCSPFLVFIYKRRLGTHSSFCSEGGDLASPTAEFAFLLPGSPLCRAL